MRLAEIRRIAAAGMGIFFLSISLSARADPSFPKPPNECVRELLPQAIRDNAYANGDIGATNDRDWASYKRTLVMRWSDWNGRRLLIDLGAGQGVAVRQAIEENAFDRAIAIDLQDTFDAFHWIDAPTEVTHRILHEQGSVETILPKYQSMADVIVDNYGAFTYSSARLHVLESAFRALRPGGRAYFRHPPVVTVSAPDGTEIPLGRWLQKKHPAIFSVRDNDPSINKLPFHEQLMSANQVLVMYRPKSTEFPALRLQPVKEYPWIHVRQPKIKFPMVLYGEAP